MKSTNLDIMKDRLSRSFQEYISGMDGEQLYSFLDTIDSLCLLDHLSQGREELCLPEEILSCEHCGELYGDCDQEQTDAGDLIQVCRKRFEVYCQIIAKE